MAQDKSRRRRWRTIQVRVAGIVAVIVIVLLIASDWFTTEWVDHPMATAFISGVLLAVIAGVVVDEYLANRARRQWQAVAALAVVELRDAVRAIGASLGTVYGVEDEGGTPNTAQLQEIALDPDANVERLTEVGIELLGNSDSKDALAQEIVVHLRAGQPVAATWAPVMVSDTSYVWVLDRYVALLNRAWRVLWAIDDRDLRAGQEAPPDAAIAAELADLVIDLLTLERDLTLMIRDLLPWPESFGPPPIASSPHRKRD